MCGSSCLRCCALGTRPEACSTGLPDTAHGGGRAFETAAAWTKSSDEKHSVFVRPDRLPCKRHPILSKPSTPPVLHALSSARVLSPQPALRGLGASTDEKLVLIHDVQTQCSITMLIRRQYGARSRRSFPETPLSACQRRSALDGKRLARQASLSFRNVGDTG